MHVVAFNCFMTLTSVHCAVGDAEPMAVWTQVLPTTLAGRTEAEPSRMSREVAGVQVPCRTCIKVWPVLVCCQGDTPFVAAASQTCHHSGHHACWRCGVVSETEHINGDENRRAQRWMGYAAPVEIPTIVFANADYSGAWLDAEGHAVSHIRPHARLSDLEYCLPSGYSAQTRPNKCSLRWQYLREDGCPTQVCSRTTTLSMHWAIPL